MLIYETLVWAVKLSSSYHWAPPPPGKASCKPLISKSTNTLSLWDTLALRLPHQISGHPIVSPLTLERALTSLGTLLKFDSDHLGLGSGVKFISDKGSGDTMLLVQGTLFEEQASRQANLCCVFPPLVNIKHLPPNFENLCCFFRAWWHKSMCCGTNRSGLVLDLSLFICKMGRGGPCTQNKADEKQESVCEYKPSSALKQ